MLSVVMLTVACCLVYAAFYYAKFCYAECRGALTVKVTEHLSFTRFYPLRNFNLKLFQTDVKFFSV
jgi:hypothetical protein